MVEFGGSLGQAEKFTVDLKGIIKDPIVLDFSNFFNLESTYRRKTGLAEQQLESELPLKQLETDSERMARRSTIVSAQFCTGRTSEGSTPSVLNLRAFDNKNKFHQIQLLEPNLLSKSSDSIEVSNLTPWFSGYTFEGFRLHEGASHIAFKKDEEYVCMRYKGCHVRPEEPEEHSKPSENTPVVVFRTPTDISRKDFLTGRSKQVNNSELVQSAI